MKKLVLAPHCDDAEFGLGGSIVRWVNQGIEVRVVVASVSDYARSDGAHVYASERITEGTAAFHRLGVKDFSFRHWFPENRAPETAFVSVVSSVTRELEAYAPSEVFVALPSFNQDHKVLYDACITALRPAGPFCGVSMLGYEYPGSCWGPTLPEHGKQYQILTEGQHLAKLEALRLHSTQFAGRNMHVSPEGADLLGRLRGSECGATYAELTYLLRGISRD